ncbi:MAG: hypothetical protein JXK07_05755 [Spirochaetes bacterium]|nr:hypothetical protein [Spirochaetota bacterium]MBN2771734.1 hypothetical protein [Spirochaetota bacterium]
MKAVLQEILAAEKEAEKIVRDARDKASRMIRETDADINEEKIKLKDNIRKSLQKRIIATAENVYQENESKRIGNLELPNNSYELAINEISAIICNTSVKEE